MHAQVLLDTLHRADIRLWVDGEQLAVDAPHGALTAGLRQQIKMHKPALLELLQQQAANDATAQGLTTCAHDWIYERPDGTRVCVECVCTQQPGEAIWQPRTIPVCAQHTPQPFSPSSPFWLCPHCGYCWYASCACGATQWQSDDTSQWSCRACQTICGRRTSSVQALRYRDAEESGQ